MDCQFFHEILPAVKLQYIAPLFFLPLFFASCEKKKTQTPQAPTKEKKSSATPSNPPKTGIPAVEAARGIGKDLDKNAEQSNKLLNDAMGKRQ